MSKHRGPYTLDELQPYTEGTVEWPYFKPIEDTDALARIASGASYVVTDIKILKRPGIISWGGWARYFFQTLQGGGMDGVGLVVWYSLEGGRGIGSAAEIAVCRHEKVPGAGARPERGWHPGRCGKCGIDMTVDSSD